MIIGSLCTGIGGIDLGLERAGMRVAWQSEIDPFCRKVLRSRWPETELHGDCKLFSRRAIKSVLRSVDVIAAGYPCQPFSLAGRRRGADDPRHLWPAIRRIVGVLRPRWVLLENVPGHLSMGFGRVLRDLAELGFNCEWDVLSAAQFGAPHLRRRVFIVGRDRYADRVFDETIRVFPREGEAEPSRACGDAADPRHDGRERRTECDGESVAERQEGEHWMDARGRGLHPAYADIPRPQEREVERSDLGQERAATERGGDPSNADSASPRSEQGRRESGRTGAPESGHAGPIQRDDGWHWRGPGGFWAEAESPVLAVAHGVSRPLAGSRAQALRAIGNSVVPQVAEWIGRRIVRMEAIG